MAGVPPLPRSPSQLSLALSRSKTVGNVDHAPSGCQTRPALGAPDERTQPSNRRASTVTGGPPRRNSACCIRSCISATVWASAVQRCRAARYTGVIAHRGAVCEVMSSTTGKVLSGDRTLQATSRSLAAGLRLAGDAVVIGVETVMVRTDDLEVLLRDVVRPIATSAGAVHIRHVRWDARTGIVLVAPRRRRRAR